MVFIEGTPPEEGEMTINPGTEGDGWLPPGVYKVRRVSRSEESEHVVDRLEIVDGQHAGRIINAHLGERRAQTTEQDDASRTRRKVRRQSREEGSGGGTSLRSDGTGRDATDPFDGEET